MSPFIMWAAISIIIATPLVVLYFCLKAKAIVGKLLIDTTDPGKDVYRLDLGEHLEDLAKKKQITLKVERKVLTRK